MSYWKQLPPIDQRTIRRMLARGCGFREIYAALKKRDVTIDSDAVRALISARQHRQQMRRKSA